MIINRSAHQVWLPANAANYRATETQLTLADKNEKLNGNSRLIICLPGHGGTSKAFGFGGSVNAGVHALARTGRYYVLAIDAGGPAEWGNPNAQQAILDAVAYARARGAKAGKYGLVGWSMGGLATLIHIGDHAADVAGAWVFAPVSDLRYIADTYNNPYGAARNSSYASEIPTAYPSGVAASDPQQNFAKFQNINVPTYFAVPSDDTVIAPEQSTYFLAQANNPHLFLSPKGMVTGGHTGLFDKFTDAEFVAHFDSLSW